MKIYVASSWRNEIQDIVVDLLTAQGYDVYDFKNPPSKSGFSWQEVMPEYIPGSELVSPQIYLNALEHPRAIEGFESDYIAMIHSDVIILVLPCGRSAHLELGWAISRPDKETAILLDQPSGTDVVPELMYKMVNHIAPDFHSLFTWLKTLDQGSLYE